MNEINDKKAQEFAKWFKCLGDGTRIRILNIVASSDKPLTVGEIVERMGKSQSTVSHHLQILAAENFVFTEVNNTRTYIHINKLCMTALPNAAAEIMGSDSQKMTKGT